MLQSKPFVKYVSLYQSRVLLDKYRAYVEVYTENTAEQMPRMKHLLPTVPPGTVSQLSCTYTSLVTICFNCWSFWFSHLLQQGSPGSSTRAEETTFLKAVQLGCFLQIKSPHLQIHSQSKWVFNCMFTQCWAPGRQNWPERQWAGAVSTT